MKSQVSPVVGGVLIVILLGIVGFFLWRGTGSGGTKPPEAAGNPSPFAPGGVANSKGGKPAAAGARNGPPAGVPGGPGR